VNNEREQRFVTKAYRSGPLLSDTWTLAWNWRVGRRGGGGDQDNIARDQAVSDTGASINHDRTTTQAGEGEICKRTRNRQRTL